MKEVVSKASRRVFNSPKNMKLRLRTEFRNLVAAQSWHKDQGARDTTVSRELLHVSVGVKNNTVEMHKLLMRLPRAGVVQRKRV